MSISICCYSPVLYLYIPLYNRIIYAICRLLYLYASRIILYISIPPYYYIYSHTTYRVLYIIVLYRYIMRYSAIMVLCYDMLWLYALMRLYAIIEPLRVIILCDTVGLWYYIIICVCDAILSYYAPIPSSDFMPPFVKGKCDLLCNTPKVNIIYFQKIFKTFLYKHLTK